MNSSSTNRTVRGVVSEIMKYEGLEGWKYPNRFLVRASEDIVMLLKGFRNSFTGDEVMLEACLRQEEARLW